MKRIIIILATLATVTLAIGATGAYPRYLEELRIGGGLGDPRNGGADLDKLGNITTDGWINTNQQYRVNGASLSTLNLSDASSIAMLNQNESVSGAWTFTAAITNAYDSSGVGYTQAAPEIVVGTNSMEGRFYGQQDVALRAGKGGGNFSVATQPSGTGATYLNKADGTGGTFFRNGAGGNVGFVNAAGTANIDGDFKAKSGHIDAGVDFTTRGVVSVSSGSGNNAPGCIKLASPNGTVWYLFARDDGTLKIHNALPTQNSNGAVVGTQF